MTVLFSLLRYWRRSDPRERRPPPVAAFVEERGAQMALSAEAQKSVDQYRKRVADGGVDSGGGNVATARAGLKRWFKKHGHGPAYFDCMAELRHREACRLARTGEVT